MPLRKKKNTSRIKIIVWALVVILLILMIVSFPAAQHTTEVVLF